MDDIYENDVVPKMAAPSRHPKRTAFIVPILAVLVVLLGILLVTLAVMYSQKERKFQELEGKTEKLYNVSCAKKSKNLLELLSSGWKFYNRSLYFFSQEKKSWQHAENACVSHGAHLTSVTSQEEMEYLHREANGTIFWIGLKDQHKDQDKERSWAWTDSTNYTEEISFWSEGEPNNWKGHHEDCVQIRFSNINAWNDETCTYKYNWICKVF